MSFDVVVVGCGVAGLSAAVSAAEGGARVAVLERAPEADRGGNSRYTDGWLRMQGEDAIADDFVELMVTRCASAIGPDMLKSAADDYENWPAKLKAYAFNDPELVLAIADNAPPAMQWLKTHGVRFTSHAPMLLQKGPERLAASGGGLAIIESLAASAEKLGVQFFYETTGRSLVEDDSGNVRGISCWAPGRGKFVIEAPAVVLASGGFQGNLEMMSRYAGPNAHLTRPVSAGGIYNKGEGIEMALAIGAAAAGQFDMFHGEPIDPRSPRHEALVAVINYGILVNHRGERFYDEGGDRYELIYDDVSWTIMRQKGGIAHLIFDGRLYDIPHVLTRIKTDQPPIRASSVAELAAQINVDPKRLEATIAAYNNAVRPGDYDHSVLDGRSTEGLVPPKSNWAREIQTDDLYAFPIMCANTFTCGGLKITKDAEVVNRDGAPIPGLYAAGETVGLYYNLYVGATSVLRGIVLGRQAGKHVAANLERPRAEMAG